MTNDAGTRSIGVLPSHKPFTKKEIADIEAIRKLPNYSLQTVLRFAGFE